MYYIFYEEDDMNVQTNKQIRTSYLKGKNELMSIIQMIRTMHCNIQWSE